MISRYIACTEKKYSIFSQYLNFWSTRCKICRWARPVENCRLVLAVYCEFFLLSSINTLPMFLPSPSVQFQHLTCWTVGLMVTGRALAIGQPRCYTVMLLVHWQEDAGNSQALFTPDNLTLLHILYSFKALFLKKCPPQIFFSSWMYDFLQLMSPSQAQWWVYSDTSM